MPARLAAAAWLEAEIQRVWALVERTLRAQRDALRPNDLGVHEIDRLLARRPAGEALRANELAALRAAAPIGRLAARLALSPLDLEILTIALAAHVEPSLEDAFTFLQRPNARRGVDLSLVAELAHLDRIDRVALVEALDAERPLLGMRLMTIEAGEHRPTMYRALNPTADLLPLLCATDALSPALRRCARLVHGDATLDELTFSDADRVRLDEVCAAAARHARAPEPPWMVIWGPRGVGKATLAAHVAARAGMPLLVLDTEAVPSGGDDQLRRAQREALINDAVLYVGPVAGELAADGARELVRRLRGFPGMIILGVEQSELPRLSLERAATEVALAIPDEAGRVALWSRALPAAVRDADVELAVIARGFRLTPGEIAAVSAEALAVAGARRRVRQSDIRRGIDRRLRNQLGDMAQLVPVHGDWEDVVLAPEQLDRVLELISRHRLADQVYRQWGVAGTTSYGKGLIALFSGPPGTGKTMLAGLIAKELGLDLYKVDLSQIVSKWVGETEKQLARVFELAERAHAVLLFDEADALLGTRTKVETANDRYGNLAVNFLLQRLEEYDGVAILTTNLESSLDPALQRRLSMHLRLDIPGEDERAMLWQAFLPPSAPGAVAIDHRVLARGFELAGGHIKNAAVRAAFLAAAEGRALDTELVQRAARMEIEDMGRLS